MKVHMNLLKGKFLELSLQAFKTLRGEFLLVSVILLFAAASVEPSADMEKAEGLINSGRSGEAIRLLSTYRPASDELARYHHLYGRALAQSKRLHESIEHLRLAYLYAPSGDMRELVMLERAEIYLKMGYHSEAVLGFRMFLKHFPESGYIKRAHLGLAEALYRRGLFNEALEHYEKAGNAPSALYGKAKALQSVGKVKDAYAIYTSLITRDREYLRSSEETLYMIGENLRLMGKYPDARVYLSSIRDPAIKQRADLSLGLIALAEGRVESAIRSFNSVLQPSTYMTSDHRRLRQQALLSLAEAYMKSGREDVAESKLLELRNKYPYGKYYDEAVLMLARLYKGKGRFDEAVSLLKELVFRRSPDSDALDEFSSIILNAMDKNQEVFLKLWRSVGHWLLEPQREQSLLKIAGGLRHAGRPFFDLCQWLLKYGSDGAKARSHLLLADFFADMGDAPAATRHLQGIRAEGALPDEVLRIKAKVYISSGEDRRAVEMVRKIRELKQGDLVMLSNLLRPEGDIENVRRLVDFYERALNRVDGPAEVYIRLADTLYGLGKRSEAAMYYRTAISKSSGRAARQRGVMISDTSWAMYRGSMLSSGEESSEMLSRIQKGSDSFSRFVGAVLREPNIIERVNREF